MYDSPVAVLMRRGSEGEAARVLRIALSAVRVFFCVSAIAAGPGCRQSAPALNSVDDAAERYVRLVLALAERDADSLDSYHGPAAWQADAHARHASLPDIRRDAQALADAVGSPAADVRRDFLARQLRALVARIDILTGARPSFSEEASSLFGLRREDVSRQLASAASAENAIRSRLDALLPGHGALSARYAAFDRRFLVSADRLPAVLARAIDGCRAATAAHVTLPPGEHVDIEYVPDFAWSAFTQYEGRLRSRIRVNAGLGLTVDRALDLACHEAYPGHHTISSVIDAAFGASRPELLVEPLFSPQTLLHESGASIAAGLAFPQPARVAFERDVLFPLAGFDGSGAAAYVEVGRLVDRLHTAEARIAQQYLDGALDFPRASAALAREALMPNPDLMLKFLNRFRSYAATYTIGRDLLAAWVDGDWDRYVHAVGAAAQQLPQSGVRP